MDAFVNWCASKEKQLGKAVLVLSSIMATIGFPAQIVKTYLSQEVGIHWLLIFLALGIYAVRIPYSIGKRLWPILIPDVIGLLATVVLFGQLVWYHWLPLLP